MDTLWTRSLFLDTLWTRYGHVVFFFGHVLDTLVLDTLWTRYGHVLDTEPILPQRRDRVSKIIDNFGHVLDTEPILPQRGAITASRHYGHGLDTNVSSSEKLWIFAFQSQSGRGPRAITLHT